MAIRLTDNHPLTKKLRKLEAYMDELGIKLEFNGYHIVVSDTETNVDAIYKETECGENCSEVPNLTETKLVQYT